LGKTLGELERSSGWCEQGLQAGEVGSAKNEAVTRCDIHEVQVDAGLRDLSRQVSEHAGPILDLYNHDFALTAYAEVRKCQRVLGRFGVRNEDVQLDLIRSADAGRRREVDAGVADRGRDAGESPGFVLDLDDQIERNRRAPSGGFSSCTLSDRCLPSIARLRGG
jgi:hypothetical protein